MGLTPSKDEAVNVLTEHNAPGVLVANLDDNATIANLLTAPPPAPRGEGERQAEAAAAEEGTLIPYVRVFVPARSRFGLRQRSGRCSKQ